MKCNHCGGQLKLQDDVYYCEYCGNMVRLPDNTQKINVQHQHNIGSGYAFEMGRLEAQEDMRQAKIRAQQEREHQQFLAEVKRFKRRAIVSGILLFIFLLYMKPYVDCKFTTILGILAVYFLYGLCTAFMRGYFSK